MEERYTKYSHFFISVHAKNQRVPTRFRTENFRSIKIMFHIIHIQIKFTI